MTDDNKKNIQDEGDPMKQDMQDEGQAETGKSEGFKNDSDVSTETSGTLGGEAESDEYGPEFYKEPAPQQSGQNVQQPSGENYDSSIDKSED